MPVARADDRLGMSKQQTAKRKKENILFDKTILDVGEIYIDVLYYNKIFILRSVGALLLRLTGR